MTRCPSDLELERLLRAPGGGSGHLEECPRCAARMVELRLLGEEFERDVFPATVEAVVAASASPRWWPRPVVWLVPALVATAAAVFLVLRAVFPEALPGEDSSLSLLAYAQGAEGGGAIADGQAVPAGAGLRFVVRPGRSCNLFVASTDVAGEVARVFPADGREGLSVQAGAAVAVPAAAGRRPGPQRFFAVCGCGDEPVTWSGLEHAARSLGGGADGLRSARTLPGLPEDALQASLLIEKKP